MQQASEPNPGNPEPDIKKRHQKKGLMLGFVFIFRSVCTLSGEGKCLAT